MTISANKNKLQLHAARLAWLKNQTTPFLAMDMAKEFKITAKNCSEWLRHRVSDGILLSWYYNRPGYDRKLYYCLPAHEQLLLDLKVRLSSNERYTATNLQEGMKSWTVTPQKLPKCFSPISASDLQE